MSKKPDQLPSGDPSKTIRPLDRVRADGKTEPSPESKRAVQNALAKQRASTGASVSEVFELPPEALREATYRIFQPKLEKAKRMAELHVILDSDNTAERAKAFREIDSLLRNPPSCNVESKRLKEVMLDGLTAILILKRTRYISIHDGDNLLALFELQGVLSEKGHIINDTDMDILIEVFRDIHPIDQEK